MEIFTWCPRRNPKGEVAFRGLSAQFGDGFAQVAEDGINSRSESWPLEFFGTEAEIQPIKKFLDRHGTWTGFLWTPPLGQQAVFLMDRGYSPVPLGGGWFTLAVTFKQKFIP
ncbi:phage tail protein [Achromobacter aegrifaciens]